MTGRIRVGIGGWTFEPWRGVFYPEGLPQKRELAHASRAVTTIEINGTFYSIFKPESWRKWRDETPDDFVFTVKGSRFCTNRKVLAGAGESVARFVDQGLVELGPKLGPICWQLAATKKFEADDVAAFLALLPKAHRGWPLRHAIEARHASFRTDAFADLCRARGVAIVHLADEDDAPAAETPRTADFAYARFRATSEDLAEGVTKAELEAIARKTKSWAEAGDVFAFFIAGAKAKNPAAAMALIGAVGGGIAPARASGARKRDPA